MVIAGPDETSCRALHSTRGAADGEHGVDRARGVALFAGFEVDVSVAAAGAATRLEGL